MKSNLPAPTVKAINDAHQCAKESAENAVEWAVKCGHMLAELKASLPRGDFDGWVEAKCDFGRSMAYAYIKASKSSNGVGRFASIRQALGYDKPKPVTNTPKGAVSVVKPKGTEETGKDRPAAPVSKPEVTPEQRRVAQQVRDSIKRQQEQVHDADDEPERPNIAEDEEDAALARAEARAKEDRERRIEKILESNERLAEALKQLAQQSALIGTLETTRDSYMRGKDAVTKMLQAEQRKVTKLEKENKTLRERISSLEAA